MIRADAGIRPAATSNNISIEAEVSADASPVHGDRIQLQQVVLNLIRNAIDSIVARAAAERNHPWSWRAGMQTPARMSKSPLADNGPGIVARNSPNNYSSHWTTSS